MDTDSFKFSFKQRRMPVDLKFFEEELDRHGLDQSQELYSEKFKIIIGKMKLDRATELVLGEAK